jgi:hypothetical protein
VAGGLDTIIFFLALSLNCLFDKFEFAALFEEFPIVILAELDV